MTRKSVHEILSEKEYDKSVCIVQHSCVNVCVPLQRKEVRRQVCHVHVACWALQRELSRRRVRAEVKFYSICLALHLVHRAVYSQGKGISFSELFRSISWTIDSPGIVTSMYFLLLGNLYFLYFHQWISIIFVKEKIQLFLKYVYFLN